MLELPEATGAIGSVAYTLVHQNPDLTLPTTVFSFSPSTRELTTAAQQDYQTKDGWPVRFRAEDSEGNVAAVDFVVKIEGSPAVTLPSALNFTVGEAIEEVRMRVRGNGELTASTRSNCYNVPPPHDPSLVPDFTDWQSLPGLTVSVDDKRKGSDPFNVHVTISGTPTRQAECYVYVYVTDEDRDSELAGPFRVYVNAAPSFGGARVPNTAFAVGELGEITLPKATLGNGKWEHHTPEWDPALPSWLVFDDEEPSALKLSGTPPAESAGQTYTLTLTDYKLNDHFGKDSDTLSLCFSAGENGCPVLSFTGVTVEPQVYTMGRSIAPLILPEARFGNGAVSYGISGLPDGLLFDPGTRRLSGTPGEAANHPFTVTYTVTDTTDVQASLTFEITVNAPLSFSGVATSGFDFTKDTALPDNITLPEARYGAGERTYSVSGLPAGLSFNSDSRKLSGTPTSEGSFRLILKATDKNGASASLTFPGRVHPRPSFPFISRIVSFPGPASTLLEARGGFGALTYSLACTDNTPDPCDSDGLPPGIDFNGETRTLSGDFASSGHYDLTLTATDQNDATGTMEIDLRVAGIVVKAYANAAAQTAGTTLSGLTIPVPEVAGNANIANAPRYTINLAVAPGRGNDVTITLSGPSGDGDLKYFDPRTQPTRFSYGSNSFDHLHHVFLFTADDDDGLNGRATIRHTVTSDDDTYDGITFDVTLVEVDNDPSVTLSLTPDSLAEDAEESEVTVTATVEPPVGNPGLTSFPADTSIALGLAGGTATNGVDYTAAFSENLVFEAGETTATAKFMLTPKDDQIYDPDEIVVVAGTGTDLDTGKNWATGGAELTITDNDSPLTAECDSRAVREGGAGRTVHVICTVTLRDANGNPVTAKEDITFTYRTVDDTAIAGEDYEEASGSVTIKAGQSSASFVIAVYDDDEQEASERFFVEFSASPPFANLPVNIYDDDSPPPPPSTDEEDGEEKEDLTGPNDAYQATVAFGATAYAATEGGLAATIAVRLHPAPPDSRSVSIPVSGRGGQGVTPDDWRILADTAAGDTWNGATGAASVVFAPGETERTFALEAVDDDDFEGNETLTLTFDADRLPEGVTADPEAAEAVVTLVDDDFQAYRGRVLKQVLAAFGRTVASDAVTLLTGRMEDDALGAGSRASLAGQTLRLDGSVSAATDTAMLAEAGPAERGVAVLPGALEPWDAPGTDPRTRAFTARELLTGSSFRYRLGAAEGDGLGFGGAWTLWGEGRTASFAGRPETDFSLDGEAASGWLGVDWRRKPAVVGISLSHYRGDVGYEAGVADGDVDLDLTSVFPYARWSLAEMDLWGVAGLGAGRLELTDSFGGNQSDMTMQMAAAGARRTMQPAGERGISLAAKADAFAVRLASEARGLGTQAVGDDLPAVNARAGRLRVALEAGYVHKLASGAVLRPTVDLGARLDSGDADSGAGVDLSGGVRYESPSGRLTLEGRGRVLLAHAASGFQEWAAGGLVRLAPEAGGRGLSLSVAPSWGMATSRTGALWDGDLPGTAGDAGARVTTEIGYGLPAFKGHGLLTPWAGTELAQDRERAWRAGMRLELRSDLALKLQGSQRENRDGKREQEIGMRLSIGF